MCVTWDLALWEGNPAVCDAVDQILELSRNLCLLPTLVIQEEAARPEEMIIIQAQPHHTDFPSLQRPELVLALIMEAVDEAVGLAL